MIWISRPENCKDFLALVGEKAMATDGFIFGNMLYTYKDGAAYKLRRSRKPEYGNVLPWEFIK